jgi:hypothetical protein
LVNFILPSAQQKKGSAMKPGCLRVSAARTVEVLRGQPNWRFNADAKTGHAFGILLARFGALRASRSGAG